jgi:hypothetical protein
MGVHQNGFCKGRGVFKGLAQTFLPSSKQKYFAVMVQQTSTKDPLDPATLFEKQFSFNPYQDITVHASSHPADMNIFLSSENWLNEVKGMSNIQIFTTGGNPLPEHRNKVRKAVNSWMVALCSKLENASPSVKLNVGDYNK